MEFNFDKEWYNYCDEAEKMKIDVISYKTYQKSSLAGMIILLIMIFLHVSGFADVFAVISIGSILLIQYVIYYKESKKADLKE